MNEYQEAKKDIAEKIEIIEKATKEKRCHNYNPETADKHPYCHGCIGWDEACAGCGE